MKQGLSVIVCCYNSAGRLPQTLKHLLAQKTTGLSWEIIVVDNASNDNTSETARNILSAATTPDKYKIVNEPEPGLSSARKRGYLTAQYDLLLFCDDDNWMEDNYFDLSHNIMRSNPKIGILGGKGEAVFEKSKPAWFDTYQLNFAVGAQSNSTEPLTIVKTVYGAGFIVRMELFRKFEVIEFESLLSDRKGNQLISGGDTETCCVARMLGYTIAYSPQLKFKHLMTEGRMNWAYLKKLYFGFGRSRMYIQAYERIESSDELPGKNLKYPLWFDRYINRLKELRHFLPGILFKLNREGADDVLRYEALRGELYELKILKNNYTEIFKKILATKQKAANLKN